MLLTGTTTIRDVVLFPTLKPEQIRGETEPGDEAAEPTSDGAADAT